MLVTTKNPSNKLNNISISKYRYDLDRKISVNCFKKESGSSSHLDLTEETLLHLA
jgi:hypothetical protein